MCVEILMYISVFGLMEIKICLMVICHFHQTVAFSQKQLTLTN